MANSIIMKANFYKRAEVWRLNLLEREVYMYLFFHSVNNGSQLGIGMENRGAIAFALGLRDTNGTTEIKNTIKSLQEHGLLIYYDESHLYTITKYFDICPFASGKPSLFARKIINEYRDYVGIEGGRILWKQFITTNKDLFLRFNTKLKNLNEFGIDEVFTGYL